MSQFEAKYTSTKSIPVIDMTPLRDGSDSTGVARALHAASKDLGFIYVKGHGIPEEVIAAARRSAFKFFRYPDAVKKSVAVSFKHRGWVGLGSAMMDEGFKADLKESFIWGAQDASGSTPDDHALRGPNQWPDFDADLERHAVQYFRYAHEVAQHLMRGFALGLNLDENFFLRTADRPLSRASYVYYPSQSPETSAGNFGAGPHTDFGVLTVLNQDLVGGLQVQNLKGEWIQAPPISGTLIINVADLLSRWTDGIYRSTPHRVVNTSGRDRLSLVLAYDPNPETMIDAREIFGDGYTPKDKPVSCGDYLVERFERAFPYRREDGVHGR